MRNNTACFLDTWQIFRSYKNILHLEDEMKIIIGVCILYTCRNATILSSAQFNSYKGDRLTDHLVHEIVKGQPS